MGKKLDYRNLTYLHKTINDDENAVLKSIKKDKKRINEDRDFLATYGQKIDFSDIKKLEPIIQILSVKQLHLIA